MNVIKVNKAELIAKLKANRESHSKTFEEAAEGYREQVIAILEERLKEAKKGRLPNLVFSLPMPINQTKEYDRAIGMLEMSIEDVVELDEHDYQQYVQDQWNWSHATTASNSLYLKKK